MINCKFSITEQENNLEKVIDLLIENVRIACCG